MIRDTFLLDDVLDSIMLEEPEPTYEALTKWCKRYPSYREALASFFARWAVQADLPEITAIDEDRLASLAVSHALNILHSRDEEARQSTSANAHSRLLTCARGCGLSEKELAEKVGLDATVLQKLDLRRLTKIPAICVERLAAAMATTRDQIAAMVAGPPLLPAGARYKSKTKPIPSTEDFGDAIRASLLSDELKRFWLEAAVSSGSGDEE